MDQTQRPQRPKAVREQAELPGHILEPAWSGVRTLVRIGHPGARFVGYDGPQDGPAGLYEAIAAEARCDTAVLDGVLVEDWSDERDLELDAAGNAVARPPGARRIFSAFDLLEVDGASLLDVPLLERKRHLEGVLIPSLNVRLTPFVSRSLRSWRDTLASLGFGRVVMKDQNSRYTPGQTAPTWLIIDKLNPQKLPK
ncbi:MAG TPA: hypothetical protein VM070_03015 [Candidatus Saccharimonadales bacterium]|nr:hypothetical protein [Candidatus Saccharimonadales bacterium]